jgi:tRNA-dihydrouridine synthase 1
MFNANCMVEAKDYKDMNFTTCPEDRPLIVQFCGNDPDTLLEAARMVEDHCDAVDINLGCPQG